MMFNFQCFSQVCDNNHALVSVALYALINRDRKYFYGNFFPELVHEVQQNHGILPTANTNSNLIALFDHIFLAYSSCKIPFYLPCQAAGTVMSAFVYPKINSNLTTRTLHSTTRNNSNQFEDIVIF